jgi:hypothetical protein
VPPEPNEPSCGELEVAAASDSPSDPSTAELAAVTEILEARVAAWDPHGVRPRWLIEAWREVQFAPMRDRSDGANSHVSSTSLVQWGPQDKILCSNGRIQKRVFDRIVTDFTQQKPAPARRARK